MSAATPFTSQLSLIHAPHPLYNERGNRENKWEPGLPENKPGHQEASNCVSIRDPIRLSLIEKENLSWKTKKALTVKKEALKIIQDPVQLAQSYQDLIQHHVALRTALFFQQAVVCYNTPFHYAIAKTTGQFFEAPTLKVRANNANKTNANVRYQAAHSSTIPGLKACLRIQHQQHQNGGPAPHYFSFLKESYLENLDNSTVGLPDFVNKIDTLIDGHSGNFALFRGKSIDLINQVAQAHLTPTAAMRQFLDHLRQKLIDRPQHSKSMTPEKKKVVALYIEQVDQMRTLAAVPDTINAVHPFFDHLLNVNLGLEDPKDMALIRKIVYNRKFEIIRESQFLESKIQEAINGKFPRLNQEQKHACRLCLTYSARNDSSLREVLEKLFSVSIETMQSNRTLCNSLVKTYRAQRIKYDDTLREIRILVRNFRKMEQSYQALLLSDFRIKLRGLTQKQLSDKIAKIIAEKIAAENAKPDPDLSKIHALRAIPTSPATISRLENSRIHIVKEFKTPENQRRKPLMLLHAKIVAKALKIQPGHFFCSFFASNQA